LFLSRKLAAEFVGTLLLLATVVGSGIMGEQLAGGNVAIALLGNTIATGAILVVLILTFGPVSGGHFNPAVTLAFLLRGDINIKAAIPYWLVQIAGGILGVWLAHGMFEQVLLQTSNNARTGGG
jgi:glycerol uptake facilitator-like aquaporin